ncbi:MAG: hypothetical protein AAF224_14300 [Pseudomonadota bacterium]
MAQPRDTKPPRDTVEQISPVRATRVEQGNALFNQCLEKKLKDEKACANQRSDSRREACVAKVWEACENQPRTSLPKPPGLPDPKKPDSETQKKMNRLIDGINCKLHGGLNCPKQSDGKASGSATSSRLAANTGERSKCTKCSGTCQTVSWVSGASSYNDVDVGGGQSPSQCFDQIEAMCESGYSRFMFSGSCKTN